MFLAQTFAGPPAGPTAATRRTQLHRSLDGTDGRTDGRTDGHRTVTQTPSHNNDLTCGSEQRAECEYRCRNHRFLLINYDELSLSLCLSLSD